MGTKRTLASTVSEFARTLRPGPLLDAFAGVGAVGRAMANERSIWANDVQPFAALAVRTMLGGRRGWAISANQFDTIVALFNENSSALRERFRRELRLERKALGTANHLGVAEVATVLPYYEYDAHLANEWFLLSQGQRSLPYRLATLAYCGAYFSLAQCIEIDSVRYAADVALERRAIDRECWRWIVLTLARAMMKVNNSTGQFAQYLKPSRQNVRRVVRQQLRSLWDEFAAELAFAHPAGVRAWRSKNRFFAEDVCTLLMDLESAKQKPAVIYADPPYSTAQYSRYYHVLDVIVDYQYPELGGDGRYPTGRFTTPFALKGRVAEAMESLVGGSAALGSDLLLSYPNNGLFVTAGGDLEALIGRHYPYVSKVSKVRHVHSSFGGPKAEPSTNVAEILYWARS
jgi:adenine-specific DNA-methyltransferase